MAPNVFAADRAALSRMITHAESALAAARRAADTSGAHEPYDAAEQARTELIAALGELCVATGRHPAAFGVLATEELSQWLSTISGDTPTQTQPVHGGEDSGG
jgi:hypothetical protein